MAERRHHHRFTGRQRLYRKLGGAIGVLALPADDEGRSHDAWKVLAVSGSIGPALQLESEHLAGCGVKILDEPRRRGLRFAGRHLFDICSKPGLTHICCELEPVVVGVSWEPDTTDADQRDDALRMACSQCIDQAGAVGVADHRGPIYADLVQNRDDVGDVLDHAVCFKALGFVAASMASVVEEQVAPTGQPIDVACGLPHRAVPAPAGMEEDGRTGTQVRVVQPDAVADCRRHHGHYGVALASSRCREALSPALTIRLLGWRSGSSGALSDSRVAGSLSSDAEMAV